MEATVFGPLDFGHEQEDTEVSIEGGYNDVEQIYFIRTIVDGNEDLETYHDLPDMLRGAASKVEELRDEGHYWIEAVPEDEDDEGDEDDDEES